MACGSPLFPRAWMALSRSDLCLFFREAITMSSRISFWGTPRALCHICTPECPSSHWELNRLPLVNPTIRGLFLSRGWGVCVGKSTLIGSPAQAAARRVPFGTVLSKSPRQFSDDRRRSSIRTAAPARKRGVESWRPARGWYRVRGSPSPHPLPVPLPAPHFFR